jgi:hypothetical protein
MPSDPHVFDELKMPFIFVPRGAPEPTEWLASHPDYQVVGDDGAARARRRAGLDECPRRMGDFGGSLLGRI